MHNPIRITAAGAGDAAVLMALSITTFCETFAHLNSQEDMDMYVANEMNIEKLTGELSDPGNLFFFAWYNNEVAAYAKLRLHKEPEELISDNPIELERIYVLHKYHGKKIGVALMNHCMDYARQKQHDTLWLGVWEHNHKAIGFYSQWGFELFGSHPFILGNDAQTDVLMKKRL